MEPPTWASIADQSPLATLTWSVTELYGCPASLLYSSAVKSMGVGLEVVTCRTFVPTTTRGRWDTEFRIPTAVYVYQKGSAYCRYTRIGNVIVVAADGLPVTANKLTTIAKVPLDLAPDKSMLGFGYVRGSTSVGQITVDKDGTVAIWCDKTSTGYFAGSVVYSI